MCQKYIYWNAKTFYLLTLFIPTNTVYYIGISTPTFKYRTLFYVLTRVDIDFERFFEIQKLIF